MFFGFILLIVIQDVGGSDYIRILPLIFFAFSAGRALYSNKYHDNGEFSVLDLLLYIILPAHSFLHMLFSGNQAPVIYSILMLFLLICLRVIVNSYGIVKVVKAFVSASVVAAVLAIIVGLDGFIDALSAVQTERGLARFEAFGAHPNLTGHNFGGAAVAAFFLFLISEQKIKKIKYGLMFLIFLVMPFAASSRGSLISVLVAVFFGIMVYSFLCKIGHVDNKNILHIKYVYICMVGSVFLSGSVFFEYFAEMLDVYSDARGVGSGFTGRGGNWVDVWSLVSESVSRTLIGSGLRTWDDSIYGFSTDSSYVNMLWELGVPLTMFFIGVIVAKLLYLYALGGRYFILFFGLFLFNFFEGFVARYLIAIGNSTSVLFLAVLVCGSYSIKNAKFNED
jgi:hypothetical protein